MFEQVTQDIRALRTRVDTHIDTQVEHLGDIAKDIARIREEMADHRGRIETRVAMIATGISMLAGSVAAWAVKHLSA